LQVDGHLIDTCTQQRGQAHTKAVRWFRLGRRLVWSSEEGGHGVWFVIGPSPSMEIVLVVHLVRSQAHRTDKSPALPDIVHRTGAPINVGAKHHLVHGRAMRVEAGVVEDALGGQAVIRRRFCGGGSFQRQCIRRGGQHGRWAALAVLKHVPVLLLGGNTAGAIEDPALGLDVLRAAAVHVPREDDLVHLRRRLREASVPQHLLVNTPRWQIHQLHVPSWLGVRVEPTPRALL